MFQAIRDCVVRSKARFTDVALDRFEVRVARTVEEYEQAFRLVHVGYVFQGIEPLSKMDLRITEHHVLPEATVLAVFEKEQLVGTITVTQDSPAGLPLDRDYPEAMAALREEGASIAEIGSFAIVRRCWRSGVAQLLSLAATRFAVQVLGVSHVVVGTHPTAAQFYRAVWAFEPLGAPKQHAELHHAPVIGMVTERERNARHLKAHFSKPMQSGFSPFEHVYSAEARIPGFDPPGDFRTRDLARWKMNRSVFRELFVERSNRLAGLSRATLDQLRRERSDETLGSFMVVA